MIQLRILTTLFFLASFYGSFAQIPANYYDGTEGLTGDALKLKLHSIIRDHKVFTYSEVKDAIRNLDEDPNNSDNIILFYKGTSIHKQSFATNNEPDFWNREHTWPKSHGFAEESDTAYTDFHNLTPSDATVNSSKSNKDFNDVPNTSEYAEGEAEDTYTDEDFWDPRDDKKGDVARILFYMATRYEGSARDLELVNRISHSGDPEIGVLFTMLQWHKQDPVSDEEKARNEGIYGYQGNRNPFVDHPEWVAEIWGGTTSPLSILNTASFNQDFGTVAAGSSLEQVYKLNAYQLEDDITVSVDAPFALSTDNSNWANTINLVHSENDSSEVFDIYIRFAPTEVNGESYTAEVLHSSINMGTVSLSVTGTEGTQTLMTIEEARQKGDGEAVYVSGVVIDAGNNSSDNRVIYDGTAGIVVRSFDNGNESANLSLGDSILVKGLLDDYNNLLEIAQSPITIEILKQNATLPEPQEVTISDIGETLESELVIIKNVSFVNTGGTFAGGGSAGNFTVTDGTNNLILRIGSSEHPLVGSEIPEGKYDITGFVGQFYNDYQLSPRTVEDLVEVEDDVTGLFDDYDPLFTVYPNPTTGSVYFADLLPNENYTFTIYNLTGKAFGKLQKLTSNKIDLSHLQKGIYFVKLVGKNTNTSIKIIKE
ncbi:endonuclease [Flammeovirgaceae bacterium SG7u.111]|nr:endonuclease [Flammeovirgaceae bacterium SG7u.132]WPO35159.1 endonuclease [Flammeovirgaceae bacterium SG7u.111]